jgi:uncharacterized protein
MEADGAPPAPITLREKLLRGAPAFSHTDVVDLGNGFLYIDRSNGRWVITERDRSDDFGKLGGFASTGELLESGLFGRTVFQALWGSGLLSLSGFQARTGHRPNRQESTQAPFYVVSLTKACNLACDYCYASASPTSKALPLEVAHALFEAATRDHPTPAIEFHGGEPLLRFGLLRRLVAMGREIAAKNSARIRFRIQSNGVLVSADVAQYLKAERFSVGISLDGVTDRQNGSRPLLNGKASTDLTLRGIRELQAAGIPFGLNVVVTKHNIDHLAEILRFFGTQGIRDVFFSPFMPAGRGRASLEANGVSTSELSGAMKQVVDEALALRNEGHEVYVKNIAYLVLNIVSDRYFHPCQKAPCGAGESVFSIDVDGSVFVCDDFNGLSEFCCGNILQDDMRAIRTRARGCACARRVPAVLETCATCPWQAICCGGCPSSAYFGKGDTFGHSPWCDYYDAMIRDLFSRFAAGLDPYALIPPSFRRGA